MVTQITEAFSVTHAGILDGSTLFEDAALSMGDIYGVRNSALEADVGDFDNVGDDSVLSTWRWFNKGTLTISSGYISFDTLALITGDTVASSGAGDAVSYSFDLWSETSVNVSPHPVLIRCPAKDSDGVVRVFVIGLYKVQFGPLQFAGPAYKEGLGVSFAGTVLMSDKNEVGATLSKRAVGRLISMAPAA